MFGSRCSLCNGKLNSRKICKECGLDNSKSEKYYKINQSSCDNLPMTHVHEDLWQEEKPSRRKSKSVTKTESQPRYSYQTSQSQKKTIKKIDANNTNKKGVLAGISTLIVIVSVIISLIGTLVDSNLISPEPDYSMEALYDPYEYLEAELPETGDACTYTLKSGQYVVGVHIAEGYYKASEMGGSDSVEVTDHKNGIYLYQYAFEGKDEYLDDLRLFNGAVVTITSSEGIRLDTENGQTGEMPALVDNFVTDSYKMYGYDEAEAGIDFEPGIYDLSTDANYSYIELTIYDEDGSEWEFRSYDLGSDGVHGPCFRNVVIPEGAIISCEDAGVELIPSEWIWTTDYMEHYY